MEPGKIEIIPQPIGDGFTSLQDRIMRDIVRRLKINAGEITRSADWQINRLQQLGMSKQEVKTAIQQALGVSDTAIDKIYSDVIKEEYTRNADLYRAAGKEFIPFSENKELQDLISSIAAQTKGELINITGSLGFVTQEGGKLKALDLTEYYQKTLDSAINDIMSGSFDYNTVLKRVTNDMTNSGLRMIDYESGHHNRVDVAARRAVMTGFNAVMTHLNKQVADDLGTNLWEITWHAGSRPEHQGFQGKVFRWNK